MPALVSLYIRHTHAYTFCLHLGGLETPGRTKKENNKCSDKLIDRTTFQGDYGCTASYNAILDSNSIRSLSALFTYMGTQTYMYVYSYLSISSFKSEQILHICVVHHFNLPASLYKQTSYARPKTFVFSKLKARGSVSSTAVKYKYE